MRWVVPGVLGALLCGCAGPGGRRGVPPWVYDPGAIQRAYPRSRYLVGMGVCGGAGGTDVMSRKQAESMAVSDIASMVEVQINDTIEDHDTSVERNGRLLEQNVRIQTTKRVVTGILSGVEIKQVFFDERTLNWHALAVLERARAGAGAAEAVGQRLAAGKAVLQGLGRGPVQDLVALRRLDRVVTELDRLAVARAVFAPARRDETRPQITTFKQDVAARRDAVRSKATVAVDVCSDADAPLPVALHEAARRALRKAGLRVVDRGGAGTLRIEVAIETATQVGSMTIYDVKAGASLTLTGDGQTVLEKVLAPDATSASRSSSLQRSRRRSLARLAPRLEAGISEMLDEPEVSR